MIKVCFPPGCYGTYFSRCLYNYTNLRVGKFTPFIFDDVGSSHLHRTNLEASTVIQCLHFSNNLITDNSRKLVILPSPLHYLDYYNNQFVKQNKKQLIYYIKEQLSAKEIKTKLESGWNYTQEFDENAPIWILREFFSFWIVDCFKDGYSLQDYTRIIADVVVDTRDIFLNFEQTFNKSCQALGLQINIQQEVIATTHQAFLSNQQYHCSQLNCQQWVYDTIKGVSDTPNPCQTIFDESYVQHLLRELGYELQCDGLNIFPKTSKSLREIIVK
jgi:hypothetical protein